jgi:hypothetical protein
MAFPTLNGRATIAPASAASTMSATIMNTSTARYGIVRRMAVPKTMKTGIQT